MYENKLKHATFLIVSGLIFAGCHPHSHNDDDDDSGGNGGQNSLPNFELITGEWRSDICAPLRLENNNYEYVRLSMTLNDGRNNTIEFDYREYNNANCDGGGASSIDDLSETYEVRSFRYKKSDDTFTLTVKGPQNGTIRIDGEFDGNNVFSIDDVRNDDALDAYNDAAPQFEKQ